MARQSSRPGQLSAEGDERIGFYVYALAWGVNQGLLERRRFEPAVQRGWTALAACVDADGKLTHVQPIGADPRNFPETATEVYGVGAFLPRRQRDLATEWPCWRERDPALWRWMFPIHPHSGGGQLATVELVLAGMRRARGTFGGGPGCPADSRWTDPSSWTAAPRASRIRRPTRSSRARPGTACFSRPTSSRMKNAGLSSSTRRPLAAHPAGPRQDLRPPGPGTLPRHGWGKRPDRAPHVSAGSHPGRGNGEQWNRRLEQAHPPPHRR